MVNIDAWGLTPFEISVLALGMVLVVGLFILYRKGEKSRGETARQSARMAEATDYLAKAQSELAVRLQALGENQIAAQNGLGERLQAQERALSKALDERLSDVSKRLGDGLTDHAQRTHVTMSALQERLAVIDAAQKNLTELSSRVVTLQDILANKQARGAFGEIQLNDLVVNALPPTAYEFQASLSNGKRADCLLKLPNPPGSIVIDSKFPLESFEALQNAQDDAAKVQAGRTFSADILKHVKDIAEKYVIPGETAESALMFLPSEAVYAELHASFRNVVEESFKRRVWIVSPTTLMATLNTVRAVLKDAQMREQAGLIQKEVETMMTDVSRLTGRVDNLQRHFDQAAKDIEQIQTSADKVMKRGEKIRNVELEEDGPAEALEPPAPMDNVTEFKGQV